MQLVVLGMAGALLVFGAWNSDISYAYRMHHQSEDRLQLDFATLHPALSPQAISHTYPAKWYCRSEPSQFGDPFCADELQTWNGMEALDFVFWLEQGRSVFAKVDVPAWRHQEFMQKIQSQFGKPTGYIKRVQWEKVLASAAVNIVAARSRLPIQLDMKPDEIGIWQLDSGAWLAVNMEADWFPVPWNTAFWMSPPKVAQLTGTTTPYHFPRNYSP